MLFNRPTWLILAALTALSACRNSPDSGSAAATLHATRALDIPSAIGDSLLLERPTAAVRLDDGRIAVADPPSHMVVLFDSNGTLLQKLGRAGEGPGEFRLPLWLHRCGGDSLFVRDGANGRITIFSPDGSLARSLHLPGERRPNLVSCNRTGTLLAVYFPIETDAPPGPTTTVTLHGQAVLANAAGDSTGAIGDIAIGVNMVLGRVTKVAVGPDLILVGTADSSTIDRYTLDGSPIESLRFDIPTRPVTDSLFLAVIEQMVESVGGEESIRDMIRQRLLQSARPSVVPPYRALFSDDAGWTWLVTSLAIDPTTRIVALDPAGNQFALEIPEPLEVLEINRGHLVGRAEDGDGAHHVVLYRIDGGA